MLNISLPDQVRSFIEEQAKEAGAESLNDYVYQLILREQTRINQQSTIETLLLEGLASGAPIEANEAWWEQKRAQLTNGAQSSDL